MDFSKVTFLKSERSNKKHKVCHSFLVEIIFTKYFLKGGVISITKEKASFFTCSVTLEVARDFGTRGHSQITLTR